MRVLLHTCCGPCTAYPLLRLREEGHEVEGFFFNPNIHPWREHQRRARTMAQYAGMVGLPLTAGESWDVRAFLEAALAAPSPAERCRACYRLRLTSTAREARARGFDAFTTTLLVSPFQRHGLVAAAGAHAGDLHQIAFLGRDFRPGWERGVELARRASLYRQNYCGCLFSEYERFGPDRPGGDRE